MPTGSAEPYMFTPDTHTLNATLGALRTAIHRAEHQAQPQSAANPAPTKVARALATAQRLTQAALRGPAPRTARRAQAYLALYPAGSGR